MKKMKSIALIATTILGISAVTSLIEPAQTAQAAAWKNGMPKALRGKWAHSVKKLPKGMVQKGSGSYRLTIVPLGIISNYFTKKHVELMPEIYFTRPRYQKISKNTYRLRGNYSNSGKSGLAKNRPLQIVKQGNKIKYKKSFSVHSKYSRWLYKL